MGQPTPRIDEGCVTALRWPSRRFRKEAPSGNPAWGANMAGEEGRVFCSVVARKGSRRSAVPTGKVVLPLGRFQAIRWKWMRKRPRKTDAAVRKIREDLRAERPCWRTAKADLRQSDCGWEAAMLTGRGIWNYRMGLHLYGCENFLPLGESRPCRRCLENRG